MGSKGPSGPSRKEIQMSHPFPTAPLSPNRIGSKGPSGPLPPTGDHWDPWLSLALSGDGGFVPRGPAPGTVISPRSDLILGREKPKPNRGRKPKSLKTRFSRQKPRRSGNYIGALPEHARMERKLHRGPARTRTDHTYAVGAFVWGGTTSALLTGLPGYAC
jgi:hypothetical protein